MLRALVPERVCELDLLLDLVGEILLQLLDPVLEFCTLVGPDPVVAFCERTRTHVVIAIGGPDDLG